MNKCPDCGAKLNELGTTAGLVMRCFKCGGFWMDANTANNLATADLNSWRRISIGTNFLSGGSGACPLDGLPLRKYSGEQVPVNINILRCDRCGKWWFPGDNIFNFKPAVDAKRMYFRLWGLPFNPQTVLLPLLLITTLLGGSIVGVSLVRNVQRPTLEANELVREFSGSYNGSGKAIIGFMAMKPVNEIEYRMVNEEYWMRQNTNYVNGYYMVELNNLIEGESYVVRILGEEWVFVAR